jgi:hypothetical protein
MAEGINSPRDCPHLDEANRETLEGIMSGFTFADRTYCAVSPQRTKSFQ